MWFITNTNPDSYANSDTHSNADANSYADANTQPRTECAEQSAGECGLEQSDQLELD